MLHQLILTAVLAAVVGFLATLAFPYAMIALNRTLNSARLSMLILLVSAPTLFWLLLHDHLVPLRPALYATLVMVLALLTGTGLMGLLFAIRRLSGTLRASVPSVQHGVASECHASLVHFRILLCLMGLVFASASVLVSLDGSPGTAVVFLLVAGLCGWAFAFVSDIHFNGDKIWRVHPWGTFAIRWDELSAVSIAHDGGCIVFLSANKRLPILGPFYWASSSASGVASFVDRKLQEHGVEPSRQSKLRCGRAVSTRQNSSSRNSVNEKSD